MLDSTFTPRHYVALTLPLVLGACLSSDDGSNGERPAMFGPPIVTLVADATPSYTWGDFNGDGKPDVFVTLTDGTVFVLLGKGDGTFQRAPAVSGVSRIYSVAVGDLNGDGKADLAVDGCPAPDCPDGIASLMTLLGNGDGTFQSPVAYPVASFYPLFIADLNGDGRADVAVGHAGSTVTVLLGDGKGGLGAPTDWLAGEVGKDLTADAIFAADVNADGNQDIVLFQSAFPDGNVSVLLGHGDGTFETPQLSAGCLFLQPAIADFNRDGRTDVVYSGGVAPPYRPIPVSVALSKGDGTFGAASSPAYPDMHVPATFAAGDLDGDGVTDLVIRGSSTSDVSIAYGNADGTFQTAESFPLSSTAVVVRLIDIDNDARLDLVLSTGAGLVVLLNIR